jgi:hypothetical protein
MNNKNKTLIMVVGILLVIVVGVSFAYFLVSVNINGEGSSTDIGTGTLPLVQYDAGDRILSKDGFIPNDVITKSFKVIITPTKDIKEITYRIYLDITNNTFVKCTDDNYDEATNLCEKDANELVYRLKDSNGDVIKEGDLTGSNGQIEIVRETKTQDVRTEYEYTIEIEFVDTNKDQNHNENSTFNGEIKVEFAEKAKTIGEIIATLNPKDTTPTFSNVATTDEGVYKVEDGMYGGYSYYWRGAVTSNYVKFGGFCWRIIRINGDGSMRLIYDGATCHANGTSTEESIAVASTAYNTSQDKSYYVGWTYSSAQRPSTANPQTGGTASNAKTQLESWYNSNIGNNTTYSSKIADGKYCNDRDVQSGSSWAATGNLFNYAGDKRLYTDYAPTLACNLGDIYILKVGLITADEVEFAGGKNADNKSYYLYNGQYYWTMSPAFWNGGGGVFRVDSDGYLADVSVNVTYGLRPVINLKADTHFQNSGNGTLESPYVVLN